ncbi:hypothetical protein LZ554_001549 [Drepanopeziza brunnea f. sp. 'monogermtubi']|nr:hypothetical protein LZ554_001549 [Drepanopeziza brunnea f. sp. 'monogermtubi']
MSSQNMSTGAKRKAPAAAVADPNINPPAKKVAKEKKSAAKKKYRYSDASSLEEEPPEMCFLKWLRDYGDDDEPDEKKTEKGTDEAADKQEEIPRVVSDKGYPITTAGFKIYINILKELEKRDPDCHGMYIYNDYFSYGTTEVLENFLRDFNKILFRKKVSPLEKWAYVEALTTWLSRCSLMALMMSDDSEGVAEVLQFFIPFTTAALDAIAEHSLAGPDSPLPNVSICVLLMIKFLQRDAADFGIEGVEQIVWAADRAGVVWDFRREIGVTEEKVGELRLMIEDEAPEERDWKKEWESSESNHPGGRNYDITTMSKAEKKQHLLGGGGGGGFF